MNTTSHFARRLVSRETLEGIVREAAERAFAPYRSRISTGLFVRIRAAVERELRQGLRSEGLPVLAHAPEVLATRLGYPPLDPEPVAAELPPTPEFEQETLALELELELELAAELERVLGDGR